MTNRRGLGRGIFDSRGGEESATEAHRLFLEAVKNRCPAFFDDLLAEALVLQSMGPKVSRRVSKRWGDAISRTLRKWGLTAASPEGYWLAVEIAMIAEAAPAGERGGWPALARRPNFLEHRSQAETLREQHEARQRQESADSIQTALSKQVETGGEGARRLPGRQPRPVRRIETALRKAETRMKRARRVLRLLRAKDMTRDAHARIEQQVVDVCAELGLPVPRRWSLPTVPNPIEPLAPLLAVPTVEDLRGFVERANVHWRAWEETATELRLPRRVQRHKPEHFEWFVRFQVCKVPYAQIALDAGKAGKDDWKTVKRAIREVAARLGLQLRKPPPGRPRSSSS